MTFYHIMLKQDNALGLPEKSLRMYLATATIFLCVTVIAILVYATDPFGNKIENVASNFWISGSLFLGNIGLYLYAKRKYQKQRRLLLETERTEK